MNVEYRIWDDERRLTDKLFYKSRT